MKRFNSFASGSSSGWKRTDSLGQTPFFSSRLRSIPTAFDSRKPSVQMDASEAKSRHGRTLWRSGRPYQNKLPDSEDPFEECSRVAKNYDKNMCDIWEDEIDTLLVFAGLFSAVVTSFVVESFQWLQEGPEDETLEVLQTISLQLGALVPNASMFDSVDGEDPPEEWAPTNSDVRVNAFWFVSLSLSLSASIVSILCKQWLRAYQRDFPFDLDKVSFAMRQSRYDGLIKWKVPQIISFVPFLLQASLVVFFVGVIDLMRELNSTVAAAVSTIAGLTFLFMLVTTLLPAIMWVYSKFMLEVGRDVPAQSPYKSPLAWTILEWIYKSIRLVREVFSPREKSFMELLLSREDWAIYDSLYRYNSTPERLLYEALLWIYPLIPDTVFCHCLKALPASITGPIVSRLFQEFRQTDREDQTVDLELLEPLIPYAESAYEDGYHDIAKDIITICYLLGPSYSPEETCIPHALEACIRVINSCTTMPLPKEVITLTCEVLGLIPEPISDDVAIQLSFAMKAALEHAHVVPDNLPDMAGILWTLHLWRASRSDHPQQIIEYLPFAELPKWFHRSMQAADLLQNEHAVMKEKTLIVQQSLRLIEDLGIKKTTTTTGEAELSEILEFLDALDEHFEAFRSDPTATLIHRYEQQSMNVRAYMRRVRTPPVVDLSMTTTGEPQPAVE